MNFETQIVDETVSQVEPEQQADSPVSPISEQREDSPVPQNSAEPNEVSVKDTDPNETETFDREYVQSLREENKRYRLKSKTADELAQRLHESLIKADGRLQDFTDLPFNPEHLDGDNLTKAIDELLERKPHLRSRRTTSDIGAGTRGTAQASTDLIGLIRNIT